MSKQKNVEINYDEVDETTGFKAAEMFVWLKFEESYLQKPEDEREADVDAWADTFCEEMEGEGMNYDRNFVRSVCTLGIYAGLRDEFQQRTGSGKAIYANGDRYDGEFFEGKKHGRGRYIFVSLGKSECDRIVEKELQKLGDVVAGENFVKAVADRYKIGCHIISYIIEYGFHPCYHGDYVRGKRVGRGLMKNKDGTVYKGEFLENKREGRGMFFYLNGDIYSGNWKNGRKHGYGTYHFVGGNEYRGMWNDGVFTHGQWIFPDGVYYEGHFNKKNRPCDEAASMHYPALKMAQTGTFKRGTWAPTSALEVCEETPVDGMTWTD
ncbi:radial spoke protein RSP10, putative [Trypanosoma equiperdum]|uniref:Uncharacterized protein n=3 Tax=Trypanozoon TaxID=39700 RepID=Q57ZM3_TRYB2|nr:hypothetical protein, conserved [Trypanosoma brucei gambiense DAL972]XP_843882.1 hypothetical protein, conserved [Trypanosoma brucei brucei TREU927]AAX79459.1 hypothetical protein, conserved [Trypanosoma brucei]SCU67359.1 radial spoke protein RSP10, putative [Trypanosoma equiperdum]AAZ10323.1 hypothetical protein, conserved [Trypanosoma brucei brucei TREU927]CBH09958.1 hypothetical protein, conserved [Trypanosoma brucei gambiense DAL972]|eukprot:XP_011772249.1 hypothetical protein, conserved [Trypanosoma brucei gambiense DAL972]